MQNEKSNKAAMLSDSMICKFSIFDSNEDTSIFLF